MKKRIDLFLACILTGFTIAGQQPDSFTTLSKTGSLFQVKCDTNLLTDIEGNTYKTVKIGFQTWMAENLRSAHYLNGDSIPTPCPPEKNTYNEASPKYQWAYGDNEAYVPTYGRLYTWYAVNDSRGVCPAEWHVSTYSDWANLETYLGGSDIAGGKLKTAGTVEGNNGYWYAPNNGATNETGFNGLPGGMRNYKGGGSEEMGITGYFWTTDVNPYYFPFYWFLSFNSGKTGHLNYFGIEALSVRCVRDSDAAEKVPKLVTTEANNIGQIIAFSGGIIKSDRGNAITVKGICWSTSSNPDTTNNKTTDDSGNDSFTSSITNLIPGTKYYVRAYAINSTGIGYGNEISFYTLPEFGSVKDIEGNVYKTVQIGAQTWMAENLKTTRFIDGSPIPSGKNLIWREITTPVYGWYNNDSDKYSYPYGALYNWHTVNTAKLCPSGWRIPDNKDWTSLLSYLGGDSIAGGKMKESGTAHWLSPNNGATNESGFTALPGGRFSEEPTEVPGQLCVIWSSSEESAMGYGEARLISNRNAFCSPLFDLKSFGFSVRCLKDTITTIIQVPVLTTDTIILISKYSAISGGVISFDGGSAITAKGICWSTSPEPDTGDFRITVGGDSYSFTVDLTGLTPDTKYYLRAFAVNQQGVGYGEERVFTTLKELLAYGSVTDIDGNVYRTYVINGFNWIVENLRVTRFNDGTPISNITGNSEWANAICPAYSWYDNDSGTYKHSYGALYNYDVVMNEKNICPSGWHIPSPVEWDSLFYLGETMKEDPPGYYHANAGLLAVGSWHCPATNETGFGAVPAGARQGLNFLMEPHGGFRLKNTIAYFWLSAGDSRFLLVDYGFSLGNDLYFFPSQFDGYSIRCIENKETLLAIPDTSTIKNTTFEIPVYVYNLPANEVLSYQFDLNYNGETIQFQNFSIEGTLSSNGSIEVNPLENKLSVAWAGQTPLNDSGTILKLRFKALESGSTVLVLTNCLINTDTVRNVENGTITINPGFGDVDGNGNIQAYDAALTLQYSVGLDPLPDSDPLPWEDWRIVVANVDGQDGILAYDASLILQYTVGLINSFPFQTYKKITYIPQADVAVSIEDGAMVFRTLGQLYGLNVTFKENTEFFGAPEVFNTNTLLATNISSSIYSVGMATAHSPAENEILMRIPLINATVQPVNLNLKINNRDKQIVLGMPTGIDAPKGKSIEIYPNPANTILYFRYLVGEASFSIYDLQGRKILTGEITDNQVDIGSLDHGLYTIRIEDSKKIIIRKLIKQ